MAVQSPPPPASPPDPPPAPPSGPVRRYYGASISDTVPASKKRTSPTGRAHPSLKIWANGLEKSVMRVVSERGNWVVVQVSSLHHPCAHDTPIEIFVIVHDANNLEDLMEKLKNVCKGPGWPEIKLEIKQGYDFPLLRRPLLLCHFPHKTPEISLQTYNKMHIMNQMVTFKHLGSSSD